MKGSIHINPSIGTDKQEKRVNKPAAKEGSKAPR